MSKKDQLFWIAPGVVQIDGKDYGIEDPLPIKKIDKDKLKRWEESGKVGAKIAPVSKADGDCKDCAGLQKEIDDLKADGEKAFESLKAEHQEEVDGLNKKIEELEADVKEKAALIEKLEKAAKKDGK